MKVRLIAVSIPAVDYVETAEDLMVFCARVSSPQNQTNLDTGARLLNYCAKHKHWSIFEMASMTVEIETSRAIAQQILRHRSFSFQEFSQRYAQVGTVGEMFQPVELRLKNPGGNRQSSVEGEVRNVEWNGTTYTGVVVVEDVVAMCQGAYESLLAAGVAPECARFVLPLCTTTRLYMTGSVRSWIHYLQQRLDEHAQKEHRLVAQEIEKIFKAQFPQTHRACFETP